MAIEHALGNLLELYRNYLRLVARSLIGSALRVQIEPSDLVQEAFLKANRDFAHFVGQSEGELIAWLRRILARAVADQVKHHRRKGRDHQRQASLDLLLERSGQPAQHALASLALSPSEGASRREQVVLLADAVSQLPPDYREVFILRTLEHVPFETIAEQMGRSAFLGGPAAPGAAPLDGAEIHRIDTRGSGEITSFDKATGAVSTSGQIDRGLLRGATQFSAQITDQQGDYVGATTITTTHGDVYLRDTGTLNADGTFTDHATIKGGTHRFKGASGHLVFRGHELADGVHFDDDRIMGTLELMG